MTKQQHRRGRRLATRRAHRERGFTMVELLVTLAITTIGMVGLVSLNMVTMGGTAIAGRSVEATAVVQDSLESLRAMPVDTMLTTMGCAIPASCPSATYVMDTVAGRSGMTYARTATATQLMGSGAGTVPNLVRVQVEVRWTDDGATPGGDQDHALRLELIRTMRDPL